MNLTEFLKGNYGSFSDEEKEFLMSHPIPEAFRLRLIADVENVLRYKREYIERYTHDGVMVNVLKWYVHHYNLLECFRSRSEWDEEKLALVFSAGVPVLPDFTKARKVWNISLNKPMSKSGYTNITTWEVDPTYCVRPTNKGLVDVFQKFYKDIIMEGKDKFKKGVDIDSYLSLSFVNTLKDKLKSDPIQGVDENKIPFNKLVDSFKEFDADSNIKKFSDIAKHIYNKFYSNKDVIMTRDLFLQIKSYSNELSVFFITHMDLMISALCKELNVTQIQKQDGKEVTAKKYTLAVRALKMYNDIHSLLLRDIPGSYDSNHTLLLTSYEFMKQSYNDATDYKKLFTIYCPEVARERSEQGRYRETNMLNMYQLEAKLDATMNGGVKDDTLIISLHPCDLITASLGNGWSSCHSFLNKADDFVRNHGFVDGTNYSGMYHCGNFDYMTGNGFIAYKPYDIANPQYLVSKVKRCFLWLNEDLTAMRQNYFYPGKPTDEDSKAYALTIREIIQNSVAKFNKTSGTQDWMSSSKSYNNVPFEERTYKGCRFHGYSIDSSGLSDPCYVRSWVKSFTSFKPIYIGGKTVYFNDGFNSLSSSTSSAYVGVSTKYVSDDDDLWKIHLSDGTLLEYADFKKDIDKYKVCTDTGRPEKEFVKVFIDNSGSFKYYYDKNHKDIAPCIVCGNYYLKSLLINGRCLEHMIEAHDDNYLDEVVHQWELGNVGFVIDENIETALRVLTSKTSVTWVSGKALKDYIPKSLGKVIVCVNGKARLCSNDFVILQKIVTKDIN